MSFQSQSIRPFSFSKLWELLILLLVRSLTGHNHLSAGVSCAGNKTKSRRFLVREIPCSVPPETIQQQRASTTTLSLLGPKISLGVVARGCTTDSSSCGIVTRAWLLHFIPCLSSSFSLSMTCSSKATKKIVRFGHTSVPWLWALTLHWNPAPSHTPSIMPAINAATLSWFISFGTEI